MSGRVRVALEVGLPASAGVLLLLLLCDVWIARVPFPFDLEWMEGGMLAHAWQLQRGRPLYVPLNPDFVPYIYPPGYAAVVAALGKVFGLTLPLGRLVSLASTALAAGAIGFVVRRHGGGWVAAIGAGLAYLGTYPHAGAFFDLVRPDAMALALLAWAVAVGLEDRRGAPVAAGLLLAAAALCKHNLAAFGLPMVVGIGWRSGWRDAASFTVAAAAPVLALMGYWQWRSAGEFGTYLLRIPLSHPTEFERAWLWMPREIGTPLPVAVGLVGLWGVVEGVRGQRRWPTWAAAAIPVWIGFIAAWYATYNPPKPPLPVYNAPSSLAFWMLASLPFAVAVRVLGGRGLGWRAAYGLGVGGVAVGLAAWMRAHTGGFVNVHMPLLWCLCLAFGVILSRWGSARLAAGAVTAQLLWSAALLDRGGLVPTAASAERGWAFVEACRQVDGPVLSPFAAWIPVYADKAPSLHYMGVWDANYPGGPQRDQLEAIHGALRAQHWDLIIGGNQRFLQGLTDHYEPTEELVGTKGDVRMFPPTGYPARPWRLLVPRQD